MTRGSLGVAELARAGQALKGAGPVGSVVFALVGPEGRAGTVCWTYMVAVVTESRISGAEVSALAASLGTSAGSCRDKGRASIVSAGDEEITLAVFNTFCGVVVCGSYDGVCNALKRP